MQQLLHYVDDLVASVSVASPPRVDKLYGLVRITFCKAINQGRYLPGGMRELLIYSTAEFEERLDIRIFAARQLEHKLRL
jgi:hypothetical protein